MAWGIWASLGIPGFGHLEADFHPVPEGRFQFGHSEKRLARDVKDACCHAEPVFLHQHQSRKIEDPRCEPETGWKPLLSGHQEFNDRLRP